MKKYSPLHWSQVENSVVNSTWFLQVLQNTEPQFYSGSPLNDTFPPPFLLCFLQAPSPVPPWREFSKLNYLATNVSQKAVSWEEPKLRDISIGSV